MTRVSLCVVIVVLLVLGVAKGVQAQSKPDGPDVYGAKNTFGVMAEYSNDSSHIVLGSAENVKLGAFGVQYQRRLIANRHFVFRYATEFRPVILESIPTATVTQVFISPMAESYTIPASLTARCIAGAVPFSETFTGNPPVTYAGTTYTACGRQMNFAQGLSPVGFAVNFRPRHRLQPAFRTLEGYIFSTKPLPIASAGSFNFAFELGVGFEYFVAPKRSVRLEYQLHHYSNDYTAATNPGVDSGIFKLTYSFGR
jgi:opacity protein-like surface antigen